MKIEARRRRIVFLGLMSVAVAALALDGGTSRTPECSRSLKDLLARSELVFSGRVEKIEYLLSEPTPPEGTRVPHTFVTYRVERVFLGRAPGGPVTLRFMGGWDSRKMRYMSSSISPQFDVGDYDILFVAGNTKSICPLVGHADGRIRIVRGRVYTEMGLAVLPGQDGLLKTGELVRLEEVAKTSVKGLVFQTQATGPSAVDYPGKAVEAEIFMTTIAALARSATPARVFVNADRTKAFAGPDQTPGPPPAENPPAKKTSGRSR